MPPKGVGCDATYSNDADPLAVGEDLVRILRKKGFCTVFDAASREKCEQISKELTELGDAWQPTPVELVNGLLGPESCARLATVKPGATALGAIDDMMSSFSGLLSPWSEYLIGCSISSRTNMFALEAGKTTSSFSQPKEALQWLEIFQWQKILALFFLGPGVLELRPFDEEAESMTVTTEAGLWILLRADALSHVFTPQAVGTHVLTSFFLQDLHFASTRADMAMCKVPAAVELEANILESVRVAKETADSEAEFQAAVTRNVQRQANRMFHKGDQIAIRGMATQMPGAYEPGMLWSYVYQGADMATDVPQTRWAHENFFHPDREESVGLWKTYNRHYTFMEGIQHFDAKFFGIAPAEAGGMDPVQKKSLEVGYVAMHDAGFKKKTLMKSWTGVVVGASQGEWGETEKSTDDAGGTGSSLAIVANRVSYLFGLMGPSYGCDLEGCSSMVALLQCADMCQHGKLQANQSVASGVELAISAGPGCRMSWAGLMSEKGRCFSFDETAEGFIRGDGCGSFLLNSLMHEIDGKMVIDESNQPHGIVAACCSGHSGKAASFSAPNGASDVQLFDKVLGRACIDPLDIDVVECHAMANILADAVELASTTRAYRPSATEEMLMLSAGKSIYGNALRGAGCGTMAKMLGAINFGVTSPTLHLNVINPHMELPEDAAVLIGAESLQNRLFSTFAAGTCKSWSGILAHAIFHGTVEADKFKKTTKLREAAKELVYWPAGGGFLERDQKPLREYTIAGSWDAWEPTPMRAEGRGAYAATVTLGEAGFERFQIYFDGNPARALHPNCREGGKDVPVSGPADSSECFGCCWQIDGRSKLQWQEVPTIEGGESVDQLVKMDSPDAGKPGDQYKVLLETSGKYRVVTWEKIVEEEEADATAAATVPQAKHSVVGSFTGWSPKEMTRETTDHGTVFTCEVTLTARQMGVSDEFQIIYNDDASRIIYPEELGSSSAGAAMGPDELGSGVTWQLQGKAGEIFKIVFERSVRSGVMVQKVHWEKTGDAAVAAGEDIPQGAYYVIGSWDSWQRPLEMSATGDGEFVLIRQLPQEGTESFKIFYSGYTGSIHPSTIDATPYSHHFVLGPAAIASNTYWTVGQHPNDAYLKGQEYKIILAVNPMGRPKKIRWARLHEEPAQEVPEITFDPDPRGPIPRPSTRRAPRTEAGAVTPFGMVSD